MEVGLVLKKYVLNVHRAPAVIPAPDVSNPAARPAMTETPAPPVTPAMDPVRPASPAPNNALLVPAVIPAPDVSNPMVLHAEQNWNAMEAEIAYPPPPQLHALPLAEHANIATKIKFARIAFPVPLAVPEIYAMETEFATPKLMEKKYAIQAYAAIQ